MGTGSDFAEWRLHDAILDSVALEWASRSCVLTLEAFLEEAADAELCQIRFEGVTDLRVPHESPWSASVHVNGQSRRGSTFVIEMQSGDEILITAKTASLTVESRGGRTSG